MDRDQYAVMYRAEEAHWWYRGMRRTNRAILDRYLAAGRTYEILDAGCGTGGSTEDLARFGRVTGVDFSTDALGFAARRGLRRLVRASVEALPFQDASFDVVTSFDVLYHRAVLDETVALREFRRVLRPGGLALVRVPAFDWLRGAHDVLIHTQRRLSLRELGERMADAGIEPIYSSYFNTLLFPLAVAKRTVDRFLPSTPADLDIPPEAINRAFEAFLALESGVAGWVGLPIGLSSVVLGRA